MPRRGQPRGTGEEAGRQADLMGWLAASISLRREERKSVSTTHVGLPAWPYLALPAVLPCVGGYLCCSLETWRLGPFSLTEKWPVGKVQVQVQVQVRVQVRVRVRLCGWVRWCGSVALAPAPAPSQKLHTLQISQQLWAPPNFQ